MPFFKTHTSKFYKEASILTAKKMVSWKKSEHIYNFKTIPKTIILTPSASYLSRFQQIFKKKLKGISGNNFVLNSSYLLSTGFGNGSPAIITHLEELRALGAEKFIFVGFAGSINSKIKEGNAFLINTAYSNTGTSYFYSEKSFFNPKNPFSKSLNTVLKLSEKSCVSVDAPYRETKEIIDNYTEKKVSFIDMETAAIFAFSEFYNVSFACILIASDCFTNSIWQPPKNRFHLKSTLHLLIQKISNQ